MPIVINPLNRCSRPLKIILNNHGNKAKAAEVSTTFYWDHSKMLRGKDPLDAMLLTQRTNGIDCVSHALAAARALEEIAQVKIPGNAQIIRNILLGLDIIYGHITHFYQYVLPDYIPSPGSGHPSGVDVDYRIPSNVVSNMIAHIWRSFEIRRTIHSLIALIGGKAPHVCSIIAGGVTKDLFGPDVIRAKSMLREIGEFVNREYSHDLWQMKVAYKDYYNIGGGEGRLLTLGEFPQAEKGDYYIDQRVQDETGTSEINKSLITVEYAGSYFDPEAASSNNSLKTQFRPVPDKAGGYSWTKGVVYTKKTYETGALARMFLSGNRIVTDLGPGAISVMGRLRARLEECIQLVGQMQTWIGQLNPKERMASELKIPEKGEAISFAESSGGSVIHCVSINKGRIHQYNIFDSSSWNICPTTQEGQRNPVEQAISGLRIPNNKYPIQVFRVVRSF